MTDLMWAGGAGSKACGLAKELGDKVVVVFGYAPGGYGGGEIPTHREAVEEIGEQVTAEAAQRSRGGRRPARGPTAEGPPRPARPPTSSMRG